MIFRLILVVGVTSLMATSGFAVQSYEERTLDEKIEFIETFYDTSSDASMVCQKYNYKSQCTNSMTAWNCTQLGGYYHCFRQTSPYSHWCGTCLP